jgi:predicted DNA-binding transcriptional regulator AlpA
MSAKANESKFHIDKRADKLATTPGDEDELLSTRQLAAWLDISESWLEIARHRGQGPKYLKYGPKTVRYRRADVVAWLKTRTHQSTAEYAA